MEVKASGLDMSIKDIIRGAIKIALLRKFRTLPVDINIEMFNEVLTDSLKKELEEHIKNYYQDISEHEIICDISNEDYMNIYFQM